MKVVFFVPNCVSWIPEERALSSVSIEEAFLEVEELRRSFPVSCGWSVVVGEEMVPVDEMRTRRLSYRAINAK